MKIAKEILIFAAACSATQIKQLAQEGCVVGVPCTVEVGLTPDVIEV